MKKYIEKFKKTDKNTFNKVNTDNIQNKGNYLAYLKEATKESEDETLILFEKEDTLGEYDNVIKAIKELELKKKAIESYLKNQMGEYEIAYVGSRKITYKTQIKSLVDTKRLKEVHPEFIKDFMKTSTSRVFKVM